MVAGGAERRRFTLLDAMVFVAATAMALAIARVYGAGITGLVGPMSPPPPIRLRIPGASPFLTSWSLAVLALRLGHCVYHSGGSSGKPGFAACLMAIPGLGIAALTALAWGFGWSRPSPHAWT